MLLGSDDTDAIARCVTYAKLMMLYWRAATR